MLLRRLRHIAGAIVYDWWPFQRRLRTGDWVSIKNRGETLLFDEQRRGAGCTWRWTSDLHFCKIFPSAGLRLMRATLEQWPITLAERPHDAGQPRVSFVLTHRGVARLPHLLMTIRSIAGQRDTAVECIVVEQSALRDAAEHLPSWVRYVHTPPPDPAMPFSRSWALNVGARHARGEVLVLHDNDMLVPQHYARELLARTAEGADVLDLKRFSFYLSREHSQRVFGSGKLLLDEPPEAVVQNLQGASIAVRRDAFFDLGGFDETFLGWGGEDNEFWERAMTRRVNRFGYLPMIHLWHEPQPAKMMGAAAPAVIRYQELSQIPPQHRIVALRQKKFGALTGPLLA